MTLSAASSSHCFAGSTASLNQRHSTEYECICLQSRAMQYPLSQLQHNFFMSGFELRSCFPVILLIFIMRSLVSVDTHCPSCSELQLYVFLNCLINQMFHYIYDLLSDASATWVFLSSGFPEPYYPYPCFAPIRESIVLARICADRFHILLRSAEVELDIYDRVTGLSGQSGKECLRTDKSDPMPMFFIHPVHLICLI